jgi:two-component system chemotaxis response regulator CheB
VAENGAQAIELCRRTRPDVITMDMMLPGVSGLAATEHIMANCPTPILVVSSSTNRAELFTTYDALAAGAVDVLEKRRADASDLDWERNLRSTVKLVSRIAVITHIRARRRSTDQPARPLAHAPLASSRAGGYEVVGIGASTGGPAAVIEVLSSLPADFTIPVLLVQHICAPFGDAFAEWLGRQVGRVTAHARDGQPVAEAAGQVVMAPPGQHLVVRDGRLRLTTDPERHSCRPSIDVLFESMAREYPNTAAACLLTGMGRDGAAGLLALRRSGSLTIAQDEASCVVYGMPREARLLGAAEHVLPPAAIGRRLAHLTPVSAAPDPLASRP